MSFIDPKLIAEFERNLEISGEIKAKRDAEQIALMLAKPPEYWIARYCEIPAIPSAHPSPESAS